MQWTGKAKLVVIKNNYIKTPCSVPGQLNYYKLKKTNIFNIIQNENNKNK